MRKQALEIRPSVSLSRDPPYLKWDPHSQQGFIPEDLGRAQRAETCLRKALSCSSPCAALLHVWLSELHLEARITIQTPQCPMGGE